MGVQAFDFGQNCRLYEPTTEMRYEWIVQRKIGHIWVGKLIKFRRTLTDIEAYGDQPSGKTSPVLLDLVRCCDWASGDVPCVAVHQPMLHGCVQRMLEHNVIIVDCLSSHRASSQ
jgi:hypothetical protein